MDIATILGLVICLGLCIFGIVFGKSFAVIVNFIDVPSILITLGGAFMSMLATSTIPDFIASMLSILIAIKGTNLDVTGIIKKVIELSNVARKEGLLALEEAAGSIEDPFMKKGIMLVVDGTDPELVRGILETELDAVDQRHRGKIGFWEDLGSAGPAWGMIGTLIGLVNMLQDMSDPSSIGPSMAVALLTTLYGSLLANWVCTPVASKLKMRNNEEMMAKTITIEGLLSIQAGENPRVIEEKLKSFLSPAAREGIGADGGSDG